MYLIVVVPLLTSLISAFYYLRLVKVFWFEGSEKLTGTTCTLQRVQQLTIFFAEGFVRFFGFFSGPICSYSEFLSRSLFTPNI